MMALPGNLTIGFLQEDNPQKAFFRVRPLATLSEGEIQTVEETVQAFPEDGYIRIVPDKNELAQFKNRMRTIGRCCALDLRKFPGENEKIRPNKNYGVGSERNALIVYSDVIGEVPCDMALEVLDAQYVFVGAEVTLRAEHPATRYVLVRREGQIMGPWTWTDAPDVEGCLQLTHAEGRAFVSKPEAELSGKLISLVGDQNHTLMFMMDPATFKVSAPAVEEAPAEAVAPVATPEPALPLAPVEPEASPKASAETPAEPRPEPAPEPAAAPEPAPTSPVRPDAPGAEDKPWIQHTEMPRQRAIAGRMSARNDVLSAQSGINPRKGRSLSEVVDDQWRRSRYDQLGHPVPALATGRPAESPIDRAIQSVRAAWALKEARGSLIGDLLSDAEFKQALADRLEMDIAINRQAQDAHMAELEGDRLKLMTEIDALRRSRSDVKAKLMEELKHTHSREVEAYDRQIEALKEELKRNEENARSAQQAAAIARELLDKTSEQVDHQMMEHLMTGRAIDLITHLSDRSPAPVNHPEIYEPAAGELISDLRVQLESAGFALGNDDAVALLASLDIGGMLIVSGPTGSGKSQLVRELSAALGLTGPAKRFVEARSAEAPEVRQLLGASDGLTPLVLLLDDINLEAENAIDGAIRLNEEARAGGVPLYLVLTVQDAPDGRALPARLLARAFFMRLNAAEASARWKPPTLSPASPDRAVSLSAIRAILSPEEDLPAEVENRMNGLRKQLEGIGYLIDRRTLNELWTFCASVMRAGRLSGLQALDRALATRALPAMLSSMELKQLVELPALFLDMPECTKLMDQPLPLPPL